ncbi:MAG: tetratricopeptide repeat protein, partial [Ginsengibacter sp.]
MNIQILEQTAWKQLDNKHFDEALKIFNDIHKLHPHNIAAIQGRIACYRKKEDFKKAFVLLEEALANYPEEPGILSEKAWYYNDQNEYDEAINAFKDVLKVKKTDPGIFLWQLYLLRRQRNYPEAVILLKEATALFPDNLNIVIEKGWIAFYQFQFEESAEIFNDVAKKEPSNVSALQGKIASLRMQRYHSEALDLSSKAIAKFKKNPGIYSERGWINIEMGNFDAAVNDFEEVITLVDNDQYAHINLAWALIKQCSPDNLDKAAGHCKTALNIHPELSVALSCLGNIAFKKGNIREAESYFVRSIKSDFARGPHADLGALYIQMERYDEAKKELDQALKNNPDDVYARLEMGYLYLYTDKIKDAIREFRIVTMTEPDNPESFKALGIALTEDKNFIE